MYFVRLTTPLDVAPDDILGCVVVHPEDPLRELVPTPAVRPAASVLVRGDVHIRVDRSTISDALLSHTDVGPGIVTALAQYGRLYFVEAARTEHGKIVELAYTVILSPGSQKDTVLEMYISRAMKWLEDNPVPEEVIDALLTVGLNALIPLPIRAVVGGGSVAPKVRSLLKNIAFRVMENSAPVVRLRLRPAVGVEEAEPTPALREGKPEDNASGSPAFGSGGESGFKQYPVPYPARKARAKL